MSYTFDSLGQTVSIALLLEFTCT